MDPDSGRLFPLALMGGYMRCDFPILHEAKLRLTILITSRQKKALFLKLLVLFALLESSQRLRHTG